MVGFSSLIFKSHEATASSLKQIDTHIKQDESFFLSLLNGCHDLTFNNDFNHEM